MGAPGSGKGTQAKLLSTRLNFTHISTGDELRRAIKSQSSLGKLAQKFVRDGKLVPDDLMVGLIKQRLSDQDDTAGYLLDGFPRNIAQAEKLDEMLTESKTRVDLALELDVPEEIILKRLAGRLICRQCGADYNEYLSPPRKEGTCDRCGGQVERRADDQEAIVQKRLEVFKRETQPVQDYYKKQGKLRVFDAHAPADEVNARIRELLAEYINSN